MGEIKEKSLISTTEGKVCSSCNEFKHLNSYDKKTQIKNGSYTYMSRCKSCRSELRKQNLLKLNSKCTTRVDEFEVFELEADDYIKFYHENFLRNFTQEVIFDLEVQNVKNEEEKEEGLGLDESSCRGTK